MVMRQVESIENPHAVEEFTADYNGGNLTEVMYSLRTSAEMWLDNQCVKAIQQAVDQFRNVVEVNSASVKSLDLTGMFITCSPLTRVHLEGIFGNIHSTHHKSLDDRILVLNKQNPDHLLDYHLEAFHPKEGKVGMRLKVLFNLKDVTAGTQYTINGGY